MYSKIFGPNHMLPKSFRPGTLKKVVRKSIFVKIEIFTPFVEKEFNLPTSKVVDFSSLIFGFKVPPRHQQQQKAMAVEQRGSIGFWLLLQKWEFPLLLFQISIVILMVQRSSTFHIYIAILRVQRYHGSTQKSLVVYLLNLVSTILPQMLVQFFGIYSVIK